jgi:predicted phosphodiesterase
LSKTFNLNKSECKEAKKEVKASRKIKICNESARIKRNSSKYKNLPKPFLEGDPNNIIIIGDLHEPFCLDGYIEHCRSVQENENCGTVIFIGDIIDNHYSSYHESDPDGYSAGEELNRAINKIANWYKVFPNATVIIGNHDRMVYRRAHTAGVSQRWIRRYNEVLETPNWKFVEEVELFDIDFNHGEGGTARTRMKNELQSQVQGHLHSQFYIDYAVGKKGMVFGMQVGCGIDRRAYAMAYGKNFKKPAIGCGTIKYGIPSLHPMKL